jgi:hypothetical protein
MKYLQKQTNYMNQNISSILSSCDKYSVFMLIFIVTIDSMYIPQYPSYDNS